MTKNESFSLLLVFIFLQYLSNCSTSIAVQNTGITAPISFHVGIILDLETWTGKMSHTCISTAVEDFYALNDHYRSRMVLHPKDSKGVASAVVAAMELLKDGVQVIVGPQMSAQAEVVAELGNKSHVPVVSFSATSPSLSRSHMPYFIRMTQDDAYQLDAIVSLVQAFGWKKVILIYEETDYGKAIIPFLVDKFQIINVRVSYRCAIHPSASEDRILKEVHKLSEMTVRVFIVHMSSPLGPLFFLKVKEMGLMSEGNAWIITEGLTSLLGSMEYTNFQSMHGVIGLKTYIPRSKELDKFWVRMIQKIVPESARFDNLNIYCLHAYDTIWALAMAAERVSANRSFQKPQKYKNSTDSLDLGMSEIGPDLLKEILNSKFKGIIGNIHLVDGQLQPLIFQIVNVEGVEREIGFWVPMLGVSQKPYVRTAKKLRTIIWPGESTVVPKGWVIPSGGKKLRIGYPVKQTFTEFVNVEFNHNTNETLVTGYCIDIFKAVIEALPYEVPYEFVPFQQVNGENKGDSYNDLVQQVFLQKYDAVVGDITITANRSLSVDFSHPYTTGGMDFLLKNDKRNYWVIMFKPFSKYVWLLLVAIFCIVLWELWILELVRSSDVPITQQIAKIPSIAKILLVSPFNYNDTGLKKSVSKAVRFIFTVIVVLFAALFCQGLYKLLTEDNAQSNIKDAKDLVKNGVYVGYQKGSLVEMLLKQLNFDDSQLKVYNSLEEYDEALSKGSKKGGVTAIFDEIPYIKLFLTKYCGKYKRIGRPIEMDGFGLVFPRGSSLVPDVNRAILSIKREKIVQIESLWLGNEKTCADNISSDDTLTLEKLKGLFVPFLTLICSPFMLYIVALKVQSQYPIFKFLRRIFEIDLAANPTLDIQASAPNVPQVQTPPNQTPGIQAPPNPVLDVQVPPNPILGEQAPPNPAQAQLTIHALPNLAQVQLAIQAPINPAQVQLTIQAPLTQAQG